MREGDSAHAGEDVEALHRRYSSLKAGRAMWETHWEDIARYFAPKRLSFIAKRPEGDRRIQQIYNPIGISSLQTLAAALHGMVMNPATKWMSLRLADDELNQDDQVRGWLDRTSKRIMAAMQSPESAFHVHANQVLEDMGGFGTACMYAGQKRQGPLYFRSRSMSEAVIAENSYGVVDTVFVKSEYTVRQVMQTWGDSASQRIRNLFDKGTYDQKVDIIHCCKPRSDKNINEDLGPQHPLNQKIAVVYFEAQSAHLLEETGSADMPYVVPRWWVSTGETYGRSPAMTALPQVKVANAAQKTMLEAAEKAVNPALQVYHDSVVSPVRTAPGGLTFIRGKSSEITQMPTSQHLPFAHDFITAQNAEIRNTMFVDQLQFTGDFRMTATEVMQRTTERMRLLGPVLGRLENEFLNPLVTRVFNIMVKMGAVERPPDKIHGADLRVEYVSPLARAQKQQLAQGFAQAMGMLEPLMKSAPQLAEQLMSPINWRKVTPLVFDWFGVDTELLNADDEQAAFDQNAQRQRAMQQIPQLAAAARHGGAAISSIADAAQTGQQVLQQAPNTPPLPAPAMPAAGMPPGVIASPSAITTSAPGGAPGGVAMPGGGNLDMSKILPMLQSALGGQGAQPAPQPNYIPPLPNAPGTPTQQ